MARKTILVDDLDGTADATVTTVPYTVGDVEYEIDVTGGHAEELNGLLEELHTIEDQIHRFTAASRTTTAANGHKPAPGLGYDPATVREWAHANGVTVSDRGRISADVVRRWRQQTAATAA